MKNEKLQDVTIRKAEAQDIAAIIDLAVELIPSSHSDLRDAPEETVKNLRHKDLQSLHNLIKLPHTGIFIAEDDSKNFLGHVIVLSDQTEPSTGDLQGWIFDLSVKTGYWGTGLAQKLIAQAEHFIKVSGLKYIGLSVTSCNQRAVRFYEKQGYLEERKRMLKKLE
jgi:ribosomal protein S18 acetylase RimI-like enzyme